MKQKSLALLLALALAFSLAACSSPSTTQAPESPGASSATPVVAASEKPTQDRAGNPIEVPENVTSIVAMTPATTEIILDLGLGDLLVAVDEDSARMFPAVAGLPAFNLYAPDLEQLMVLKADILFSAELNTGGMESPFLPLIEAGHCVADIPTASSIADIYEDIRFIAACLDAGDTGETLIAQTQEVVDEVRAVGEGIEERKSVVFEISASPDVYAAGEGTFLDEVLGIVGADNALAGNPGWLPLAEEDYVAANPDVILTNTNYIDDPVGEILGREGWGVVGAVANGEVYYIDNAASSLPNHNVSNAIIEIAKAVYPEAYADF